MESEWVMNDKKVTIYYYEWHREWQRSQFSVLNNIVNDNEAHNVVNDSFSHKPDGLLVKLLRTLANKWRMKNVWYVTVRLL